MEQVPGAGSWSQSSHEVLAARRIDSWVNLPGILGENIIKIQGLRRGRHSLFPSIDGMT
jgi:hypothetical protein